MYLSETQRVITRAEKLKLSDNYPVQSQVAASVYLISTRCFLGCIWTLLARGLLLLIVSIVVSIHLSDSLLRCICFCILQEIESEDEDHDDEAEDEPEPEVEVAEPALMKVVAAPKETERQLSKKELKKKELAELDAVLAELGISENPSDAAQDGNTGKC